LATKSCELTGWKNGDALDTLAAAYAETGDFPHAIVFENKSIALRKPGDDGMKDSLSRLDLYQHHKPYRDKAE
jgi:hypothetical protein